MKIFYIVLPINDFCLGEDEDPELTVTVDSIISSFTARLNGNELDQRQADIEACASMEGPGDLVSETPVDKESIKYTAFCIKSTVPDSWDKQRILDILDDTIHNEIPESPIQVEKIWENT